MKKLVTMLLLSLYCAGILSGCAGENQSNLIPGRIVTSIDIHCQKPTCTVDRHYTQPEKISLMLTYLRLLRPIGPMKVSQEAMQGDHYEIVVHLQDGNHRVHRQRSAGFAAMDRSYWGRIDETLGKSLPFLMALIPSDTVQSNCTDITQKSISAG